MFSKPVICKFVYPLKFSENYSLTENSISLITVLSDCKDSNPNSKSKLSGAWKRPVDEDVERKVLIGLASLITFYCRSY